MYLISVSPRTIWSCSGCRHKTQDVMLLTPKISSYCECMLLASGCVIVTLCCLLQELNTSSMVNVAWALAKTDYEGNGNRRTRTLLDNIAKSAMGQMDCFTPEQLSRLLWAFSTLHHYHQELYDAVAAETLRQVSSLL